MAYELHSKLCLWYKVGYAHCKDLRISPILHITIAHNFGDMVCESLLKPVNNGEWSQWNARWNGNLPKDNG